MGSETLPTTCYILSDEPGYVHSDESSIPLLSTNLVYSFLLCE